MRIATKTTLGSHKPMNFSKFSNAANLDGETNLKQLETPPSSTQSFNTPAKLEDLKALVECEHPHADMYKFVGRLTMGPSEAKKARI